MGRLRCRGSNYGGLGAGGFPSAASYPWSPPWWPWHLSCSPGWEDYLLLATCPLCHLLVIWFARHHLMHDEEPGTLREL
jgi:hypothetical protein